MHSFSLPPERYSFYYRLIFAVFVLALPVVLAGNSTVFRDGDVSWHIAAGRWILEHRSLPRTDPFSFTMAGQPWLAIEWGAEIIYAAAFGIAGYAGLAAVVALAMMALVAALYVHLRRSVGPVGLLLALVAFYLVFLPFIMARPHLLALPILAWWTAVLIRSRVGTCRPPFAILPLMTVWANLHGSFVFGFVIAAAVALDVLVAIGWERRALTKWLGFGLASLVVSLLTPYGLAGFIHPFSISTMENLPAIGEWQASSPEVTPLFYGVLLAGLAAVLVRRPRFTAGEMLLLLFALAMAFWHVRHQSVFIILAVLLVAPRLGRIPAAAPLLFDTPRERRLALAATGLAAIAILAVRASIPLVPEEGRGQPTSLVAAIPPALRTQPVFNEYSFGGPLILAGVRPYIDGRADMYGDRFIDRYLKIVNGDFKEFDAVVRQYRIAWTMMPPESRLAKELDRRSDWRRVYADRIGAIHVRAGAGAQRAGAPPVASDPAAPRGK